MINFLPLRSITESFEPELSEAVERVVRSGWYLNGEEVSAFENEFSAFIGTKYALGVGNGLDALTLSLLALKDKYHLTEQAEVLVPNMTFIATAEAVVRAGMVPIMVDVSDSCGVLTLQTIQSCLTEQTRIILPVHLYGYPVEMDEICAFAKEQGLLVLEDAAQAHGASIRGKRVGHWGNIAAFSFYPGKNLGALGDGGAVVTDDYDLYHRVKVLANYGAEEKYHHTKIGVNSRLDEIQGAVLRIKLRRLDQDNEFRRRVANIYSNNITNPFVRIPFGGDSTKSVFHIYPIRSAYRTQLYQYLLDSSVECLIHYPLTITHQEAMRCHISKSQIETPVAQAWADEELSLPISPVMKEEEIWEVINKINNFKIL